MVQPSHSDYLATVTDVIELDSSLFGIRCRLKDGTLAVIVVPKGLVTVEKVALTVQAVMNIAAIKGVV